MKKCISVIITIALVLTSICMKSGNAFAASTAPLAGSIVVTNNLEGKADTIYVYGVESGDLVKVYDSAQGENIIAYGTVPKNKIDITFKIAQLGTEKGSVYVSVVSKGADESSRTKKDYAEEPKSTNYITKKNVTIFNNAQKSDTITISGLNARDVVKAYGAAGNLLGSKTASTSGNDVTISVPQLGSGTGIIYITITSKNMGESDKSEPITYDPEPVSIAPSEDDITINNNVKKADEILVSGLNGGDVVKIYNSATAGKLLGSKKVPASGYDATINVSQLGTSTGYVYVSITSSESAESTRTSVQYPGELESAQLNPRYITVTNNAGKPDTVYVTGLTAKDVIKVYTTETKGSPLGTATASTTSGDATVTIPQLPLIQPEDKVGEVYVSVTSADMNESTRVSATYGKEGKTDSISDKNIIVTNNVGKPDTVYVSNLIGGDTIRVYDSAGKVLGYSVVPDSGFDTTISINQIGINSGSIYVSITNSGKLESSTRTEVTFAAEDVSTLIDKNNISIANNANAADVVYVTRLSAGTIVRVYDSSNASIGSATVGAGMTDATITTHQLKTSGGTVYITVTQPGAQESSKIAKDYGPEGTSITPNVNNISVKNNVGKPDTVYVSNLLGNDIVRIYDLSKPAKQIGTATVASSETYAIVTIDQLGEGTGYIDVSVSSTGMAESSRVTVKFDAEDISSETDEGNISVTNNAGKPDVVYITRLSTGDVVKVYDVEIGGNPIESATVGSNSSDVTISIPQIGPGEGDIYVTIARTGEAESKRVKVHYDAEAQSATLNSDQIVVKNNIIGTPDTIYVPGLNAGDVIKVYTALTKANCLGTATVADGDVSATVSVAQLGTAGGSVYVSVTRTGKLESSSIEAKYDPEGKSTPATYVKVTNNAGAADTVYVSGLAANDVVNVYDQDKGGKLLGTATVATYSSDATVSIEQLGSAKGIVYVTVTSPNKLESNRTPAEYDPETKPVAIVASQVTIENNSGIASTVTVKGLKENDLINIYDKEIGGTLLGYGTVAAYNSEVTIPVSQLSATGGKVYISVTSMGKLESDRTPVDYDPKAVSKAPDASRITIENNYEIADTITITNLDPNTVVKVYSAKTGGSPISTTTVAPDSSKVTIPITQLDAGEGYVYVTVTNTGKTESERTEKKYSAEGVSDAPAKGNITIVNNSGMADTITITGLELGSIVKVYNAASGGSKLASATADASTLATTINYLQLGTGSGSVFVSVTSPGKRESSIRTEVEYEAESIAANERNITILNNAGISDSITVSGLAENDVIKAYDAASNGNLLGFAMVPVGSNKATITIEQLAQNTRNVYISVTNYGRAESKLTKATYEAEKSATAPYVGDIHVVNNVDIDDTITVYNLNAGDVIRVYDGNDTRKKLLGYATVANNKTEATVSVEDLGTSGGVVYVSVITKGKNESASTEATYVAEGKSTAPYSGYIYVTNDVTDTVLVTNLTIGDKVKVYNTSTGGDLLGYGTVTSSNGQVAFTVSKLAAEGGKVYVSVTSMGKTESNRTMVEYVSE